MKMPLSLPVVVILCLLGVCSCVQLRPPERAATPSAPPLELEKYFAGRTRSWGSIEDRFGKVRRTFTADLLGVQRGPVFHLDQRFTFDDGKTERRHWQIRRIDAAHYEATATGIVGTARGEIKGSAAHLQYTLAESNEKGGSTKVQFDQWLWRQEKDVLFNRADVRKFGILLLRVSEVFEKQ